MALAIGHKNDSGTACPMNTVARLAGLVSLALLIAATAGWGALALLFAGPAVLNLNVIFCAGFALAGLVTLATLFSRRWRWRLFAIYVVLFAALLWWWSGIKPSNDRDWQTDVAVLPYATIDGDLVTVHNIRNFDYRSEFDYTPAYYDKQFDLRRLRGVDVLFSYWMGPAIAHVFLSFDFGDDNHLAISIETRKERGEGFSSIKGFFRQFELYYVVADERDVIRVRTNYRRDPPEQVYLFRAIGAPENMRRLFLAYMEQINELKRTPRFYNTLTTNCTTAIWLNSRVNPNHLPLHWQVLLSGYLPRYLYDHGRLDTGGLSFEQLKQRSLINARAQAADQAADFSRRIRESDIPPEPTP